MLADVPEEKAANIALGTVASKARAALIDACAAYREQDSQVSTIPVFQVLLPTAISGSITGPLVSCTWQHHLIQFLTAAKGDWKAMQGWGLLQTLDS